MARLGKRMARSAWALVGALAVAGCASSRTEWVEEDIRAEPKRAAKSREARGPIDARRFVAQYRTPSECELDARRLQATAPDEAWEALEACVTEMHFTQLQTLLSKAWVKELMVRPGAAELIAHVVALRGGSIEGDLRLLHEKRVPIFALQAAVTQPETYKGRYVMFRARVGDVRTDGEKPTVWLVEHSLGSVASDRQVGFARRKDSASVISGNVDLRSGGMLGDGALGGAVGTNERTMESDTVQHFDNVSSETGREALGRLAKVDPFLEPGRDFVILARFDGVRITSGSHDDDEDEELKLPVLSIVSYFEPHPLVIY